MKTIPGGYLPPGPPEPRDRRIAYLPWHQLDWNHDLHPEVMFCPRKRELPGFEEFQYLKAYPVEASETRGCWLAAREEWHTLETWLVPAAQILAYHANV